VAAQAVGQIVSQDTATHARADDDDIEVRTGSVVVANEPRVSLRSLPDQIPIVIVVRHAATLMFEFDEATSALPSPACQKALPWS
jgi:hypothetical protein